jgi:hypothetical protein
MKNIKLKLEECSNNNLDGLVINIKKIKDDYVFKYKKTNTIIVDVYNEIEQMQEIYKETGNTVYWDLKLIIQFSDKIIFINKITLINE